MNMEIHIPTDGSVASGYITIINKYAPHPAAAALVREYLFSDEGQINVARAGARPVRDVELPADVVANMIPEAEYTNVLRTIDFQQDWITASATIGDLWDEYVTPYMS
jgi:putative spermidine/putrescine transport system substrate-binding protein